MKKISLLLCAFALVLSSCNKDDDNGSSQDLLIGSWTYYKYFENDEELPLLPCENQESVVVLENGTYTFTFFSEIDGECVMDTDLEVGTWENLGNGNYKLSTEDFTVTEQIVFEGNTFYFLDTETFGDETFVTKHVYIRN